MCFVEVSDNCEHSPARGRQRQQNAGDEDVVEAHGMFPQLRLSDGIRFRELEAGIPTVDKDLPPVAAWDKLPHV